MLAPVTGATVVDEVLIICAAYRDRFREWPTHLRLDPLRFRGLALALSDDGFRRLSVHVRLAVRDGDGSSAGGRGIVELGTAKPSSASLNLARVWLGDIERECDGKHDARRITVVEPYWRDLARRALDRFSDATELDLEHLVLAAEHGPDRIENAERESRELEVLFDAVYLASFGLDGIAPKTLAIGRRSYGILPDPHPEPILLLHRDDGLVVTMDAPHQLRDPFPVDRSRWTDAVMGFAGGIAELANRMRGA